MSAVLAEMDARLERVRVGVDIGFADATASRRFRELKGGVWMTVEEGAAAQQRTSSVLDPKTVLQIGRNGELPFEDNQFAVALLSQSIVSGDRARVAALIRETHRILQGGGCLIFAVDEASSDVGDFTQRSVYELLRDGFDVVGLRRPPWWKFGFGDRVMTVCARRKNWRNRGKPIVGAAMPVSSAMLSPRERRKVL